jgi:Cof subfamily protein (haloacid dehalogenase superfamily)
MIKLIASDLDGTLLQNGAQSLPEGVIPFIEKITKEHDILFVAASGRQYPNLVRLFGSASKHMAFICENGSLVFYRDKLIAGHPMDTEAALTISHDILSLPGCELQISGEKTCYLIPKSERFVDRMVNHVKNDIKLLATPEDHPEPYYKISVFEESGIAEGHGPELLSRHKDKAQCTISGKAWLDCVAPGVNKGRALQELIEQLGITPDECAAFGDNFNDLEMLDSVKYGYVMDNAIDEIKSKYNYHCSDVVTAIKELLAR